MPSPDNQHKKQQTLAALRRAEVLTAGERSAIARMGANARWEGKTAEERKVERARGREGKIWPRCPCGRLTIGVARNWGHKCVAPEPENEPREKAMAASA